MPFPETLQGNSHHRACLDSLHKPFYVAENRIKFGISKKKVVEIPLHVICETKSWKNYYYSIESFENELAEFTVFLESIDRDSEEVVSILTNIGWVRTGMVGGQDTGVKGYSVITRKKAESLPDPSGVKVSYPGFPKNGMKRCLRCAKEFAGTYESCPYCDSKEMSVY